jgi:glyoxylase I family protein
VHLTLYPTGSFRTGNIAAADCHFAFRTDNFDGALATLTANGFREDAAEDDPMRVMVCRLWPIDRVALRAKA